MDENENAWVRLALEAGQLHEAMAARATIEQAKGLLMALRRCGPQPAIHELKVVSQRSNVKVQVLAAVLTTAADHAAEVEGLDPLAVTVVMQNWGSLLRLPTPPPPGSHAQHAW